MKKLCAIASLGLLTISTIACSTTAPPEPPPAPVARVAISDEFERVTSSPELLLQRAEMHRAAQNRERAYYTLALVHELHPKSKQDPDAFLWAARLGKRFREADSVYPNRNSIWNIAERAFLYQWLEELASGDEFPEKHAQALLVDASYALAQDFMAYAKARPALARWQITVEEDNGRVFAVQWSPIKPAKRKAPAPK